MGTTIGSSPAGGPAASRLRRNAVVLLPLALLLPYLGVYVLAFPRYTPRDPESTSIEPPMWRVCGHPWQRVFWSPLALAERSWRGGPHAFSFVCLAEADPTITMRGLEEGLGLERHWP